MRETVSFRDNLEDILSFSKGKRILTTTDVSAYTGRSRKWCREHLGIDRETGISAATLARKLCE